ncbi:DUF6187 family protein [Amycolatopsis australiensis]|uniref:Uncharacterized protein n=1 Tax=Amycolatopsis australiensis TaxID=546364 RepID=A0A1K1RJR9_9PSEU|nr:DUF6187 family protein [Amycolatopsis australiensis]SFW72415.1 hypothetical protein SAMN04489730_3438 [Amycolatopsis australiensis]
MSDNRFALPAVDEPGSTEAGIILLGLDVDRLLAGVGFARLADDPALVTQAVDQARHGVFAIDLPGLVRLGRERWLGVRCRLPASRTGEPGALRREWERARDRVADAVPEAGPASAGYLTACLLRRAEVDRFAEREEPHVLPEVPAR